MGYMGTFLDIDLTTGKIYQSPVEMRFAEKFIGGKGLGAKILYDKLKSGIDPLSSANFLLFMTGPLSGTSVQTSGRWCIATKSPHTGLFLDSQIGGKFGHRLKKAGFDYIIIRGKAINPVYIEISNDSVEIHHASDLWGKGTYETENLLKNRHNGSEICSIGPAGEKW